MTTKPDLPALDPEDELLISRSREGDEGAFTALMKKYQNVVYNFARKVCRDPVKAGEAFQDTFISVYQKLPQFDGRSRFSTWLYTIVTNHCLMKRRRRKVDELMEPYDEVPVHSHEEPPAGSRLPLNWHDTPVQTLLTGELGSVLDDAIRKLPIEYRVVFILRDVEQKSNEETAEIVGITVEATKSRIRRARAFLRKKLLPYISE